MKKIVAAFDGLKYSASTRDYAIELAKQNNMHLVGVFLDDALYNSYKIYDLVVKEGVSENRLKKFEEKDKLTRSEAAKDFDKTCQQAGLKYAIHHDRNIASQVVKHESIYTDLLLIDSKETLTHYDEKIPTRFIRELLEGAQCPVMVVPKKYTPIEKIILLYDGEPSSVHAIKMFSYVMPQLAILDTDVITIKPATTTLHLPDNRLMKEFMKRHYPKAKYIVKKGRAENEIIEQLKQTAGNALIVLGAYRRGSVSRLFRESMADVLMKQTNFPLFIAHNR